MLLKMFKSTKIHYKNHCLIQIQMSKLILNMIWFLVLTVCFRWNFIVSEKCFEKFEEDEQSFCSCDLPVYDDSFPTLPYEQVLLLCSLYCSQTKECVAFNFWSDTQRCQIFNKPLEKFSVKTNCSYFALKSFLLLQFYGHF